MANKILLEVVTPDKMVVSEEAELVTTPGTDGVFGVMANHCAFLSTLQHGELRYTNDNKSTKIAVSEGFCEISKNKMSVLVESAETAEFIDVDRALRAKERAEKRLQEALKGREDINEARARAALARALTRLKVAGHPH